MVHFPQRVVLSSLLISVMAIAPSAGFAQPTELNALTKKLSAKSFLLVDEDSGKVLAQRAIDEVLPAASFTKLMSALVIIEEKPDWAAMVKIAAVDIDEDKLLQVGQQVRTDALFQLGLVGSSNTAMNALTRVLFTDHATAIRRMNEKARVFGMTATNFTDVTGLNAHTVSTARDVMQMARIAFSDPRIHATAAVGELTWFVQLPNGKTVKRTTRNTNLLLAGKKIVQLPYTIVGSKTGHVDEGGYSVTVMAENKSRRHFIAVVMGSANHFARFQEADVLLQWASKTLKPLSRIAELLWPQSLKPRSS